MTKLINLDDLAATTREVIYKGVKHNVLDLSLENFVLFQGEFDALIAAQTTGAIPEMIAMAHLIVTRCVPSFGDVKELNLRQLMALVQLVADFYPSAEQAGNEPSPAPTL